MKNPFHRLPWGRPIWSRIWKRSIDITTEVTNLIAYRRVTRILFSLSSPASRTACLVLSTFLALTAATTLVFFYDLYATRIDGRLNGRVFTETAQIYAAPFRLYPGDRITAEAVAVRLGRAGFEPVDPPLPGHRMYALTVADAGPSIAVSPEARPDYRLDFRNGRLARATEVSSGLSLRHVELPPELVTPLFDGGRTKRRVLAWEGLPTHLLDAIVASEDRRFYTHSGVDLVRVLGAAWANLRGDGRQGASTLTMQLAGSFFLDRNERTWSRKLAEMFIALILERRLNKRQILTMYANEVYLGHRDSFAIHGFGEAAAAYFGKAVMDLTLSEAAALVGMLPAPNAYAPTRNLERSIERRNRVLGAMRDEGMIDDAQSAKARAETVVSSDTPTGEGAALHMVDYVRGELLAEFSEDKLTRGGLRIYTTLDPDLQRLAAEAVRSGIANIEAQLRATRRDAGTGDTPPVQAALIVLDPRTGAIKALVGGRDYGVSQLNRALALRQPGSVFKPFVYAAALSAYQNGLSDHPWTAMSKVLDEPTVFEFDGKPYQPANFGQDYFGEVTLRYALTHSLNVATIKVAESVGYTNVVALAHRAGLNQKILPTPAVALGAYEVTPVEVAGAYTIFANQGVRLNPYFISMVRSRNGMLLDIAFPRKTPVLEPAVAFLMTNLMEDVINHGTGAGVRARGFDAPAAGKTGSSHDGWFAGYTSDLICVVWVGYDTDRELPLTGGASALPIWTEFMKRAIQVPEFSHTTGPLLPAGVARVDIDPESGELATPQCPRTQTEYFLQGTQPGQYCHLHSLQPVPRLLQAPSIANIPPQGIVEPVVAPAPPAPSPVVTTTVPVPAAKPALGPQPEKKKPGFFGRIFGVFGGGRDDSNNDKPDSR